MAEVQLEGRVVGLSFVVCGPPQSGKSTLLSVLRGPLRGLADGANSLRCASIEFQGDPTIGVAFSFAEVHPNGGKGDTTVLQTAACDGVLFVADSRRERLRENMVAWAGLLERLREAGRDDVPIVIALHRSDSPNALPASDLDGALGAGRHPWFETRCDDAGSCLAPVIEVVRRAAARAHPSVESFWPGWERGRFLASMDAKLGECNSRVNSQQAQTLAQTQVVQVKLQAAPVPSPSSSRKSAAPAMPVAVEVVVNPSPQPVEPRPATSPRPAKSPRSLHGTKRSPMVRYATRLLGEANRTARDRRRAVERLSCVVDDSRRPMTYLAILMGHLEREGKRLPGPLQEAVAGGSEVLKHLEHALIAAAHGVSEQRGERGHEELFDVNEGVRACFSALRRDATAARVRLRLARLPTVRGDADGLSALLWAALGALLRATRRRERRLATVRVSARERSHGLRIRLGRFDAARRGTGLEELLLARRIALRLGVRFSIVESRRGGRAIVLDLPPEVEVVESSRRHRRTEQSAPR
jgi:hypothetical protein